VAHALQHLNAWLEREAVVGERGGGGFELSIPGRETVKPSWEADLLSKRERICRGTGSSNPSPSSRESAANLTSSIGRSLRGRRLDTICDALGATSCSARLPPFSFGIAIWRE